MTAALPSNDVQRMTDFLRSERPPGGAMSGSPSTCASSGSTDKGLGLSATCGADGALNSARFRERSAGRPDAMSQNGGQNMNVVSSQNRQLGALVASLQRQCEQEKRSSERQFKQLERRVQSLQEERARESEGRDKRAELQGIVKGLVEEVQTLTRRAEGVDERLRTRTSGIEEAARQQLRELEQQLQASEHKQRLATSSLEGVHERITVKLRRQEQLVEEHARRLARFEENQGTAGGASILESRIGVIEQQYGMLEAKLQGLSAKHEEMLPDDHCHVDIVRETRTALEDSIQSLERSFDALATRVQAELEEQSGHLASVSGGLGSVKVKLDSQSQRFESFAERAEIAHIPALEALRAEYAQHRSTDQQDVDDRCAAMAQKIETISDEIVERIERLEDRINSGEGRMGGMPSSRGGTGGGGGGGGGGGDSGDFHAALYRLRSDLEGRLKTETDRLSRKFQELQNDFQALRSSTKSAGTPAMPKLDLEKTIQHDLDEGYGYADVLEGQKKRFGAREDQEGADGMDFLDEPQASGQHIDFQVDLNEGIDDPIGVHMGPESGPEIGEISKVSHPMKEDDGHFLHGVAQLGGGHVLHASLFVPFKTTHIQEIPPPSSNGSESGRSRGHGGQELRGPNVVQSDPALPSQARAQSMTGDVQRFMSQPALPTHIRRMMQQQAPGPPPGSGGLPMHSASDASMGSAGPYGKGAGYIDEYGARDGKGPPRHRGPPVHGGGQSGSLGSVPSGAEDCDFDDDGGFYSDEEPGEPIIRRAGSF